MDSAGELARWGLDLEQVRQRLYDAPHARGRERWHALWLLGQGWTQVQIAELFQVDERTIRRRWQSACLRLHQLVKGELPPS